MPLNEDLPGGSRGLPRVKNCRGSNDWLSIMEVSWDDKEVCGFYMVRFCPHDLFVNTRSDLGAFQFLLQFIQFQFSVV